MELGYAEWMYRDSHVCEKGVPTTNPNRASDVARPPRRRRLSVQFSSSWASFRSPASPCVVLPFSSCSLHGTLTFPFFPCPVSLLLPLPFGPVLPLCRTCCRRALLPLWLCHQACAPSPRIGFLHGPSWSVPCSPAYFSFEALNPKPSGTSPLTRFHSLLQRYPSSKDVLEIAECLYSAVKSVVILNVTLIVNLMPMATRSQRKTARITA